ncbi:MAG: hypothetical protein JAY90_20310 [Candidatus Thiodiazotropha lotti]|nr:hypothetical protein [Candidatus Thiodiazotropha lotti]
MMERQRTKRQTDPRKFIAIASKSHAEIAGELADQIKETIYAYEDRIPLALAVGVLRIVEQELMDNA